MGLTLLVGPANAGKVERLLDRYLAVLDRDPILIVPNRPDVDWAERELLLRSHALLNGWIGTFPDLFHRVAETHPDRRPVVTETQQALMVRAAVAKTPLNGLGDSARSPGFADALRDAIAEVEAGMLAVEDLRGPLAGLYASYRGELDRLGLWDRQLLRAAAAERLGADLDAWEGQPVFAYGFEDLTAAEWALIRTLSGRTDVTVSLPYEPGRPAFEWLRDTSSELQQLAAASLEELTPRYADVAEPALAYLERALFGGSHDAPPPIEGAIQLFEGAGARGTLELVGEEVLQLLRDGAAPAEIGIVVPSLERWRAPVETAFGTLGIPYAVDAPLRFGQTPYGQALLALLRFAWSGAERSELFRYLRSPYSGLKRSSVDFVEGRLRGRAIAAPDRVEEELEALREARLPALDAVRAADSPIDGVRDLAVSMLRAAYGLERPPADEDSRDDLRAYESCRRVLVDLEAWERIAERVSRDDVMAALERTTVRQPSATDAGRVPVIDLMRARTRRFEHVFVLGLEEGSLPRRSPATPFLDDEERRRLGPRLRRKDAVTRDRYLFYTACTRPTQRLYLVREAASDEGSPREASPFWEEVVGLFPPEEVARATTRRPLSSLTWRLESAPSERERLRALAILSAEDQHREEADSLARANGWERRLSRAQSALRRPTQLSHPIVLEELRARSVFNVTELERFADCSSAWFIDRMIDPKTIDPEVDPKLRGSIAHNALFKFFTGFPKVIGSERIDPVNVEDAVAFMRECLAQALAGVRLEMTELQRGLELGDGIVLSGKIDRIDVEPLSARGIVQDYKAGKHAPSAREMEKELRLQIPLYMLVLRDLVGIEPLGGLYRPLAGGRRPRGLLRAAAKHDALSGYSRNDYLDEDAFWAQVESARTTAGELAGHIRAGNVRHNPKGGECPDWCDLWPMCRVERA